MSRLLVHDGLPVAPRNTRPLTPDYSPTTTTGLLPPAATPRYEWLQAADEQRVRYAYPGDDMVYAIRPWTDSRRFRRAGGASCKKVTVTKQLFPTVNQIYFLRKFTVFILSLWKWCPSYLSRRYQAMTSFLALFGAESTPTVLWS